MNGEIFVYGKSKTATSAAQALSKHGYVVGRRDSSFFVGVNAAISVKGRTYVGDQQVKKIVARLVMGPEER